MTSNFSIKGHGLIGVLLTSACLTLFFCMSSAHAGESRQTQHKSPAAGTLADAPPEIGAISLATHPAVLRINGKVSRNGQDDVMVDLATLQALPHHSISTSTVVTDGVLQFDGVLMRDVLDYVGASGNNVTATALNGYEIEIPMQDFVDFDVVLAWAADGQPLRVDNKGPFWIVYPRDQNDVLQDIRYDYRWVWQLSSLRVH